MRRVLYLLGLLWVCGSVYGPLSSYGQGGGGLYAIHIPAQGHGRIELVTPNPAAAGSVVELRIVPEAGYGLKPKSLYHCHHATEGLRTEIVLENGRYTFRMPAYETRVVGAFARLYSVSVSSEVDLSKGTFEFSPSNQAFEGAAVSITPRAVAGYRLMEGTLEYRYGFESWRAVSNNRIVMPNSDVEVRGTFGLDEQTTWEVVPDDALGAGVIAVYPIRARGGEEVRVRLTLPRGKRYVAGSLRWCRGRTKAANASDWTKIEGEKFLMPIGTDVFVTADIEDDPAAKYRVRVEVDASVLALNGSALVADPSELLREGDEVYVRVQAPEGYKYEAGTLRWRRESGSEWMRIVNDRFVMPAEDVVVSAVFKKLPQVGQRYRVSYAAMEGGAVQSEFNEYLPESRVVLRVNPQPGYALEAGSLTWEPSSGGAASVVFWNEQQKEYVFSMPESDVLVRARFERVYRVSVWDGQDGIRGTITVSPNEEVRVGQRVSVKAEALPGNVYVEGSLEWSGNGGAQWEAVMNNTLVMPASNVVVRASFVAQSDNGGGDPGEKPVYYTVRLRVQGDGKLEVRDGDEPLAQDGQVQRGKELRISTYPGSGSRLDVLLVNEEPCRDSVLVLDEDVTIMARFAKDGPAGVLGALVMECGPNPFDAWLRVSLRGRGHLQLFSLEGVLVREVRGEGELCLDGGALPSGIYVLRVRDDSGGEAVRCVVRR